MPFKNHLQNNQDIRYLRVHGDNILECEHALKLIATALDPLQKSYTFLDGPAYAPIYRITSNTDILFNIQLFPGYDRWNFDITKHLVERGACLRESTDANITKLNNIEGSLYEQLILALEFCGALPAGNNAWQRCGRALASAYAQISYLYFAEIGGIELDSNRESKASRFPNPLVPFAYLTLGELQQSIAIPIFVPSPSLDKVVKENFSNFFGLDNAISLIRQILLNESTTDTISILQTKAKKIIQMLASQRKKKDNLTPNEWESLDKEKTGRNKALWLIKRGMPWQKKIGIKTITNTFKKLLKITIKSGAVGIGSKEMPLCLISQDKREKFSNKINQLYKKRVSIKFLNWLSNPSKPLLCIWIAGFKPRGDDSRPDRGLVPLGRMIFGKDNVDILTIVYGPAKTNTWNKLEKDLYGLTKINGLWEAIIQLSNGLLIDSPTGKKLRNIGYVLEQGKITKGVGLLKAANAAPNFGEQDIDTVLHLLFSNEDASEVYEGLCNPPGGDWSGISIKDFQSNNEYKWTSLPRVSGSNTKRPDHLIQFHKAKLLISIESKDSSSTLEKNIGICLRNYISKLIQKVPIAYRNNTNSEWSPADHKFNCNLEILAGAAFRLSNGDNLKEIMKKGKLDIIFAMKFSAENKEVIMHILFNKKTQKLSHILRTLLSKYHGMLKINELYQ